MMFFMFDLSPATVEGWQKQYTLFAAVQPQLDTSIIPYIFYKINQVFFGIFESKMVSNSQ